MFQLNKADLKELLKELNSQCEVKKFPIRGFVRNIVKGILPYSVFVDEWPQYSTIVTKPNEDAVQHLPVYRLGIYSQKPVVLTKALVDDFNLPSSTPIRIYGLHFDLISAVEAAVEELGLVVKFIGKNDPRNIIYREETTEKFQAVATVHSDTIKSALPKNFYLSPLVPEVHAPMVAALWKTHNWSEFYNTHEEGITATKYYIGNGPTVGVFCNKDNMLVSWILSDIDGSGLMGITKDEYRHTSISMCVHLEFERLKLEMGEFCWGYLAKSNTLSKGYAMKFGDSSVLNTDEDFVHCVIRPKHNYSKL